MLARFGLAEFDRPACFAILVPQLGRLGIPIRRYTTLLDRLLLVVRIALTRRRNQAGIDDLTRHGDVTGLPQHGIELLEQSLYRPGRGQLLPEQPDRARVRNTILQPQSQEAHKRQPVIDEKFGAFIGKIVSRLDDQDLEHQHWVERWPPALRPVRVAQRRIQFRPKQLEIHCRPEAFKLIAQIAQQLQPIIEIEKAWLPPHAFAPNPSNPMESEMLPIDQVFRTVQLVWAVEDIGCPLRSILLPLAPSIRAIDCLRRLKVQSLNRPLLAS